MRREKLKVFRQLIRSGSSLYHYGLARRLCHWSHPGVTFDLASPENSEASQEKGAINRLPS
jgi:hypothetical protein